MPIYEYECKKCGAIFEAIVKPSDSVHCDCGSDEVEKQLTSHSSYSITGNNTASVTPKRFRKG